MSGILLSVILPVYNAAPWLAECLESLLASGGKDMEILLIDDGSTDESGAICREFQEKYAEIRHFYKENGGVSSARNLGLSQARGSYIAWVDPDDLVAPEWYPELAKVLEEQRPDMVVFDSLRFGDGPEQPEIYGRTPGPVDRELFWEDLYRDLRMRSGLPNKVLRASCYAGLQFDEKLPLLEDFAAMPQLLQAVQSVYYIPRLLYRYRQHPQSLTHSADAKLAFRAVEIAVKRAECVPARFHSAAVTAVAMQMLSFSWNHCRIPEFYGDPDQLRQCRRYLRAQLSQLMRDRELTGKQKICLLLLALGLYGPLQRRKAGH